MTPSGSTDYPVLARIVAAEEERLAREAQSRDDAEHDRALSQLAELEAEIAAISPSMEANVAELTAAAVEAERRRFAGAAAYENQRSNWTSRRQQLEGVLARTLPVILRTELTLLDHQIATQCARIDVNLTARSKHDQHVRSLQAARDAVRALATAPTHEILGKLQAIRAAILPAVRGGEPQPEPSFLERAAEGVRAYLRQRATETPIA